MPQDRKRGRDASRRRAAQAAARAEARRRQQRMRVVIAAITAVVVVLAVVLVSVGGGKDTTTKASDSSTTTAPGAGTTASTSSPTSSDGEIPDDHSENTSPPFVYGDGECPPPTPPATPKRTFTAAPKKCIVDGTHYRAVVQTSEGTFTIELLAKRAPGTVNNFVVLARWGFFDGLSFHRVVPGFVIQGGDPNGDGSGGPGYTIADELPVAVTSYKTGAVAMANSGPNTNGSQFFVCTDCAGLPSPGYSLFGQVLDGMDVVRAIEALGSGDGPPSKKVTIDKVTIQEG
jgi:cyclophilin family peptidyl-prolyl cis-trans isomerase